MVDISALIQAHHRYAAAREIRETRAGGVTADRRELEVAIQETAGQLRDASLDHRDRFLLPAEVNAFERRIGTDDLVPIRYLELGLLAARSVARVLVPNVDPRGDMMGTGFLVAPGLFVTNHHVLREPFWARAARVEFGAEDDLRARPRRSQIFELDPETIYFAIPELDVVVVAIRPNSLDGVSIEQFGYIRVFRDVGKIREGEYANIIQHPAGRPKEVSIRNNKITVYNQDGTTSSENNNFIYYEADTEGGSSGAPVFNDQWYVVGLHRRGVPRVAMVDGRLVVMRKDGTPARETDPDFLIDYIANEGIRVSRIIKRVEEAVRAGDAMATKAFRRWEEVKAEPLDGPVPFLEAINKTPAVAAPALGSTPAADLEIGIRGEAAFAGATGFDPDFLGAEASTPLPQPDAALFRELAPLKDASGKVLHYDHFSVMMHAARRVAAFAAWNIDGTQLFDPGNRPRWSLDGRMDPRFQPDDVIFSVQLNRGHIVRRKDVAWGPQGRRAHTHTFCLTNVIPQVHEFNDEEWGDLEDHILFTTDAENVRVSVFAGPVFGSEDPFYDDLRRGGPRRPRTGMRIPLVNWKIVAWLDDGRLRAAGFLRDQSEELEREGPLEIGFGGTVQKQALIRTIQDRTGLDFGPLAAADTFAGSGLDERVIVRRSDIVL